MCVIVWLLGSRCADCQVRLASVVSFYGSGGSVHTAAGCTCSHWIGDGFSVASSALYETKARGKGRIVSFEAEMDIDAKMQ